MDLSPAQITEASFRTTRKGYDPDEVDAFLAQAAKALEAARQQATAMEARARAAVSRLQEVTAATEAPPAPPPVPVESTRSAETPAVQIPVAEAETISRTLLLAQKTADTTVAEAKSEADRLVAEATAQAEATIDSTREMSAQMIEEARVEARKSSDLERTAAQNEVEALVARREFLIGDVDQLERFLIDQRDRLRGAARQIEALCERVPEGLGGVRPPVLSASEQDDPGDPTQEMQRPAQGQDARPPASLRLQSALDGGGAPAGVTSDDDTGETRADDDGDGHAHRADTETAGETGLPTR